LNQAGTAARFRRHFLRGNWYCGTADVAMEWSSAAAKDAAPDQEWSNACDADRTSSATDWLMSLAAVSNWLFTLFSSSSSIDRLT
jgi:hypothetical protein